MRIILITLTTKDYRTNPITTSLFNAESNHDLNNCVFDSLLLSDKFAVSVVMTIYVVFIVKPHKRGAKIIDKDIEI